VPGSLVGDQSSTRGGFVARLQSAVKTRPRARLSKGLLFFGFAFAVMADPVSSVAYAIEAALRALGGHLNLLLPTMGLVIGLIALVTLNYWQLVRSFPEGGGSPEAAGRAFGEKWSFVPIGALVVDFALTIAISIAAAGSALIAYVPDLAPARVPIALGLVVLVAALTWFGHGGRLLFALMTCLFIAAAIAVLGLGWLDPHTTHGAAPTTHAANPALVAVILAFPVAMALATGTEAPATSIAQLGQLDNPGRRRFGRGTLALTIVVVGSLTLALTALAVHLHVGIPGHDQTQIAELAHAAVGGGGLFGFFQLTSGLLLLAAASSSFQAGPGLLKALARTGPRGEEGLLPRLLGRTNDHHTPVLAVWVYALIAAAIVVVAGGREQELVLVYAVAVFVSFLAGLLAMARFSHRRGQRLLAATNLIGAVGVAFTLLVNLTRGYPLLALGGTLLVAAVLYWRWVRAGRPHGIEAVEREAELEDEAAPEPVGRSDLRDPGPVQAPAGESLRRAAPFDWPASVRFRARLRRFSLDEQLARGADPCSKPTLAQRARELCQPKLRRKLAENIERVVEDANLPSYWLIAPLNRRGITECRPLLLGLAEDLRSTGPVYARGVALVQLLLMDGRSPIYAPSDPRQLEEEVRRARVALMLD
jgi:hypothetical protein